MIQFDTSSGKFVLDVLGDLSGADLFEPLDEIGARFIRLVRLGFRNSVDPYGNAWEPLKVRDGQPLLDTGWLEKSFVHQANLNGQLRVGSNLIYAATHNEGRGPIPKRQIIPGDELPTTWEDEAVSVIDAHLQEVADRATR